MFIARAINNSGLDYKHFGTSGTQRLPMVV